MEHGVRNILTAACTTRIRSMARGIVVWLFGALVVCGCGAPAKTFVIYHTSDIHGGISAREAWWHTAAPKRKVGGFAALSALLQNDKLT